MPPFRLSDTIIPDLNTARKLADMATGKTPTELSAAIKGEIRFFSFIAGEQDGRKVEETDLPQGARIILIYRGENIIFTDPDTKILPKDEVVILTHSKNLKKLRDHWTIQ